MKELLTYIVQSLVEKPEEVSVTERVHGGETVYEVRVADGDMGKVIGRQGRIVKEIRILMRAVAQGFSRYHGLIKKQNGNYRSAFLLFTKYTKCIFGAAALVKS